MAKVKNKNLIVDLISKSETLPFDAKVVLYNECTKALKKMLGLDHPVLAIQLIKAEEIVANSYNPNTVAPPEMELLRISISEDGMTQPVVTWKEEDKPFEVVDGFHRHRTCSEDEEIKESLRGYLPIVIVNEDRNDLSDRMASTIRHNRARGKHKVDAMSDIIVELKRRNKTNVWIAKHLGMSEDEVLRLQQITGLAELFSDKEFSMAWERKDAIEIEEEINEPIYQ